MVENREPLSQKLRHRVERLEQILDVTQTLNTTQDLAKLLRLIVTTAATVTDCEAASILLLDPLTNRLRFEAAWGAKSEELKPLVVPIEGSVAGWVAQHHEPLLIGDAQADPRHWREVDAALDFTTSSLLAVPLLIHGRCLGVL